MGDDAVVENSGNSSRFIDCLIVFSGFLASIIQPAILLFSGKDVNDAIWPHAYRTLQTTMLLRENVGIMVFFAVVLFCTSIIFVNQQIKGKPNNLIIREFYYFC